MLCARCSCLYARRIRQRCASVSVEQAQHPPSGLCAVCNADTHIPCARARSNAMWCASIAHDAACRLMDDGVLDLASEETLDGLRQWARQLQGALGPPLPGVYGSYAVPRAAKVCACKSMCEGVQCRHAACRQSQHLQTNPIRPKATPKQFISFWSLHHARDCVRAHALAHTPLPDSAGGNSHQLGNPAVAPVHG